MLQFFGKFHPLLVHLPIGILVLAVILKIMALKPRWSHLGSVLPLILLITFLSSIFTCISGYLLSLSGGYDAELVKQHKWAGIILTLLSGIGYLATQRQLNKYLNYGLWTALFLLIGLTGHLGGSLTHGEDFLSLPKQKKVVIINDVNEARAYKDLVLPILEEKCYTCHSAKKQKGELRLDSKEMILKGGEHGHGLVAYASTNSLIYERLVLDPLDKEHMPPKGKPQLTEKEIQLIEWWIDAGADFDKKVVDLKPQGGILAVLKSFETKGKEKSAPNFPIEPVKAADAEVLVELENAGIVVVPVDKTSHYLSVNFLEKKDISKADLDLLSKIKDQTVWLKLGNTNFSDAEADLLADFKNLYVLHLNNTTIGDAALQKLSKLERLQLLNLTYTKATAKGVESLKGLKNLKEVYLFESAVKSEDWKELSAQFPNTNLDSGGYQGLFLEDTVVGQ